VIATFVVLLATYAILLAGFVWRKLRSSNAAHKQAPATSGTTPHLSGRQSDWLRKNINVPRSTYFEDDDVKSQSSLPKSRLFSIGSVSTVDDGRYPVHSQPSPTRVTTQGLKEGSEPPHPELYMPNDDIVHHNRAPFEEDLTPTKNATAAGCHSHITADMKARKRIAPMPEGVSTNRVWKLE
jgi:hypothetical protein